MKSITTAKISLWLTNFATVVVLTQCPVLFGKSAESKSREPGRDSSAPLMHDGFCFESKEDGRFVCENLTSLMNLSLPEGVTVVELSSSHLTALSWDSFDLSWRKLEQLILSGTTVERIERNAFARTPMLKSLSFIGSGVRSSFDICIFTDLPHLQTLKLDLGLFKMDAGSGNQGILTPCQCQGPMVCSDCHPIVTRKLRPLCADKDLPTSHCSFCYSTLPNLETVSIRHATLLDLSKNIFSSLEESSVMKIELYHNNLTSVDRHAFQPLKNVDHIEICNNPETNWSQLAIALQNAGWKERRDEKGRYMKLVLSSNRLTTVPTNVLESVSDELYELVLSHNNFASIEGVNFPSLPKLSKLDLEFCGIQSIENGAFVGFRQLEYLSLKGNNLVMIPTDVFPPTLSALILANNPLSLREKASQEVSKKEELRIPPYAFSGLSNLTWLKFSGSRIPEVRPEHFAGLRRLLTMELDGCSLQRIRQGSFAELSSLTSLDLTDNFLELESIGNFAHLTNLERLYMGYNKIDFKPGGLNPFSDLINLKRLYLPNNNVHYLEKSLFAKMNKLAEVALENNFVQAWDSPLFDNVNQGFALDIADNHVTEVTSTMLAEFKRMGRVDLSRNPFTCDCKLKNLRDFASLPNSPIFGFNTSSYFCILENHERQLYGYDFSACSKQRSILVYLILAICSIVIVCVSLLSYWRRWDLKVFMIRSKAWWRNRKDSTFVEFEYDAFVSYCEGDRPWVFDLFVPEVEMKNHFRLCLHERDFQVGRDINDNITAAIQLSRKLILVVSRKFLSSKWCQFEVKFAHRQILCDKQRGVIVVLLESLGSLKAAGSVPETLKYFLQTKTYLEWPQDPSKLPLFWSRLRDCLET